jgi:hypothetical protein
MMYDKAAETTVQKRIEHNGGRDDHNHGGRRNAGAVMRTASLPAQRFEKVASPR